MNMEIGTYPRNVTIHSRRTLHNAHEASDAHSLHFRLLHQR